MYSKSKCVYKICAQYIGVYLFNLCHISLRTTETLAFVVSF